MPIDLNVIWVYRIIPIQNLEHNLRDGLYCKSAGRNDPGFISIGNNEIISERDNRIVPCYPETVVNDYVPFYFSVRTPMLYNIITGHAVRSYPQKDIIYLCCKLNSLINAGIQWCFTDGNAAKRITRFSTDIDQLNNLDWRSIKTTDFRDENADGDEDRTRKKHAEFLVRNHVPRDLIQGIAVKDNNTLLQVETILKKLDLSVPVKIKPSFYFQ